MTTHGETRHERRERLQRRNDRNALITGIFGIPVFVFGLLLGPNAGGILVMALGALAFGVGFYSRGRPVR